MRAQARTVRAWIRLRVVFALLIVIALGLPAAAWGASSPPACRVLTRMMAQQKPGPVFLASYPTATVAQLKNTAYLYDNAIAAIALIGCGQPALAGRIGAAILIAQAHDRFWHDGRLRNAYVAGPVRAIPVKLPGWWDGTEQKWVEDGYEVGSDTGNEAFAMLALLACYRAGLGDKYLAGARRLGRYLTQAYAAAAPAGFRGGTFGEEPAPQINIWKSTEHNADLAAAYQRLAAAPDAAGWQHWALRARRFVRAMWQPGCGCFAAGTGLKAHDIDHLVATDAQLFPLLAIAGFAQRYGPRLRGILHRLRDGGGITYSIAAKGVWTEGTAQLALYRRLLGQRARAGALLRVLAKARAADGSYYATLKGALVTGFGLSTDPSKSRVYFHLPHLGALAWVALAQCGFDPFTLRRSLPVAPAAG